jgi:hypothetical protein
VLALAACQQAPGPSTPHSSTSVSVAPSATPGASLLTTVVITRTGGIAGVMHRIEIAPDGSWVYTDRRTGKVERGTLDPAQRQRLAQILADPALREEARRSLPPGHCADAFIYAISAGDLLFGYEQCAGPGDRPLTQELLRLVSDATPM